MFTIWNIATTQKPYLCDVLQMIVPISLIALMHNVTHKQTILYSKNTWGEEGLLCNALKEGR